MTTQKVTLVIDCASADGTLFTRGSVRVLPSFARLGDPADMVLIEQAPARVSFAGCTTAPGVDLFPNDLIGPQSGGSPAWSYTVYYDGCPGNPQPWSFQLLSTDGTTQRLSSLAQSPVAQDWRPYMPAPAGTATPGYVPVATGTGEASAWGPSGTGGSGFPASPVVTGTPAAGQVLTATSPTAADWQDPGAGSGTVTSASVVTANGFAGTVANPTTTPAITVSTTVTGLLKGNGTAVSAAAAGTDYLAPTGSGAALTGITAAQVGADASGAAAAVLATSAQKSANLSDLASAATARTNLGLGSAAVQTAAAVDLRQYGAKCDGQAGYYGQAVSGSPTLTDPTASFTSALTGKTLTMPYVGPAGGVWTGTVTAVPSSTTLTISGNAGTNSQVSGTAGAITSGSSVLTDSVFGAFTHQMNGAIVTVQGAGPAGAALTGQMLCPDTAGHSCFLLAAVGNQNVAQTASTTVSGASWTLNRGMYVIGSDDTTAWQSAVTAAAAAVAAAGAAYIYWAGQSHVSATITIPGGVHLTGTGQDSCQPGTAYPVHGSVLRAHGAFSGTSVLATTSPPQYLESVLGGGARDCTIDAARVAAWAVQTQGNWAQFARVTGRCGTSGAIWLDGWQTTMHDCTWAQWGQGDCMLNQEADVQMIGGYLKSGASMLHLGAAANDLTMIGVHFFNSWPAAAGGTNYNVLADQANISRITLTSCYLDNVYGPQVRLAPPAGGHSIVEVEFIGCKFFQAGTPWYTFTDNTYPVFQLDTSSDAGAVIDRVTVTGATGAGVSSAQRFSALCAFNKGSGTQAAVTFAACTIDHIAAIYTGSSPSQVSFSHVKCLNSATSTWMTSPYPLSTANPLTATGNGSTTAFVKAHGMNGTPKRVSVIPQTAAAAAPFFCTVDTNNLTITYVTAPANAAALAWWTSLEF